MRIFMTGAKGQLGSALQTVLADEELVLTPVDVTDYDAVMTAVAEASADVLIHCAAFTHVDGCALDPAKAYRVNGMGTQNVALACQRAAIPMVHVSSNEVFAGDCLQGYEEWMPLNPCNAYGRSKAAAEFHVRSLLPQAYIVRLAWLFAPGGRNFIHAIRQRAQEKGEIQVVTDEVGSPTYALDLAAAIAQLLRTGRYGTYHFTNAGSCSRWGFANEILRQSGLSHVRNTPILGKAFNRPSTPPRYAVLHNIAGTAVGITLRPWQEALAAYLAQNPA